MAANPIDELRVSLMRDVLPVGMAVVERARQGGARRVMDAFTGEEDPLSTLQSEGEPAAREVRDSLDRLQPGLGNPVLAVEVHDEGAPPPAAEDPSELIPVLERIEAGLRELEGRLPDAAPRS
ncbi:hypothetical protein EVJ50_10260 [Synechococcus sp. RSCCF101]|uniref:hypothetical protein n=1 Tax=Synechococcus sp. RSCCF101 TaxID=2511069 RepID=UPI001246A4DE|nr:hypothetical protein [Synechococcus sp. RSCCF101]QEY32549.1 hypothetical protein EVJ50_10260 [Synechococcus sp. RSCCF101]